MLVIKNLTKHYKGSNKGVNDISIHVEPGDIYAFVGHNGAGKTTTLKCITGIHDFEKGEILVAGVDIKKSPIECKPKLLILDEPFVGLDPKAAVVLKQAMRELCEAGGAIFFSTHVLDVAEKLCNKVAIIKDGQMINSGKMSELVKEGESLESVFMEVLGHVETN